MDNKSKLIIIILGLTLVVVGFIAFQSIYSSNVQRHRHEVEINKLNQDNDGLNASLTQAKSELKNTQNKLEAIQKEVADISNERDDLRNKYDEVFKEKDVLAAKIKELEQQEKGLEVKKAEGASALSEDSYWASVLKDKTDLELHLAGFKQQLEAMSIEMEGLTKQNNDLALELNKINQAKADLERQINYSEKLAKALSEDLVREKNDKMILAEQLDKIKQDYSILQQQLRDETSEKLRMAKQAQKIKEENDMLAKKIAEMDQVLQDRMSEIMGVKEQLTTMRVGSDKAVPGGGGSKVVELPPIVVQGGQSEDADIGMGLTGSVLAVNKENNFVVIDIGEASGIKAGMLFSVYRNYSSIATVKIIQVRRDISAADIKSLDSGQQIRIGDAVRAK